MTVFPFCVATKNIIIFDLLLTYIKGIVAIHVIINATLPHYPLSRSITDAAHNISGEFL